MGGFDGWLHDKQAKRVLKLLGIASLGAIPLMPYWFPDAIWLSLGLLGGAWMGWWLTPDIDLPSTTHEEYRAMHAGFIGALWVAAWTPYAFLVPHRSIYSHSIIGTAIRYAMLLVATFALWAIASLVLGLYNIHLDYPWSVAHVSFFVGLAIQDSFHYMLDGLGPLGLLRR